MKPVKHYISTSGVANMADLCWINREGEVSYRESTKQPTKKPDGTSSVAPWSNFMPSTVEPSKNIFTALTGAETAGSSKPINNVSARKKKEDTPVLDDWENFED